MKSTRLLDILLVWKRDSRDGWILVGVIPDTQEDKAVVRDEIPDCYFQPLLLGDYDLEGLAPKS